MRLIPAVLAIAAISALTASEAQAERQSVVGCTTRSALEALIKEHNETPTLHLSEILQRYEARPDGWRACMHAAFEFESEPVPVEKPEVSFMGTPHAVKRAAVIGRWFAQMHVHMNWHERYILVPK